MSFLCPRVQYFSHFSAVTQGGSDWRMGSAVFCKGDVPYPGPCIYHPWVVLILYIYAAENRGRRKVMRDGNLWGDWLGSTRLRGLMNYLDNIISSLEVTACIIFASMFHSCRPSQDNFWPPTRKQVWLEFAIKPYGQWWMAKDRWSRMNRLLILKPNDSWNTAVKAVEDILKQREATGKVTYHNWQSEHAGLCAPWVHFGTGLAGIAL